MDKSVRPNLRYCMVSWMIDFKRICLTGLAQPFTKVAIIKLAKLYSVSNC
jgi:hypothetical protein